jgi:hypothetical protein
VSKTHLAIATSYPRLACSPPWVINGRWTVEATFVLDDVTCGACRRTKLFKEAEQKLASRTHIAPD